MQNVDEEMALVELIYFVLACKCDLGDHLSSTMVWWWIFPRLRGFCENARPFLPGLHFFFYMEISLRTLIPFFMPGLVQVAQ